MEVWGIASEEDDYDLLVGYVEALGLTYPVLYDATGSVLAQYNQVLAFTNTKYPQDWIVGADGTVVYFSNTYEPPLMIEVLDDELGD